MGLVADNHPIGQYIPLIYHLYIANWGVICYLPPIKGTRKLHWPVAKKGFTVTKIHSTHRPSLVKVCEDLTQGLRKKGRCPETSFLDNPILMYIICIYIYVYIYICRFTHNILTKPLIGAAPLKEKRSYNLNSKQPKTKTTKRLPDGNLPSACWEVKSTTAMKPV